MIFEKSLKIEKDKLVLSKELKKALRDPRAVTLRRYQSDLLLLVPTDSPPSDEALINGLHDCYLNVCLFDVEMKRSKTGPVGLVRVSPVMDEEFAAQLVQYESITKALGEMEKSKAVLRNKINKRLDMHLGENAEALLEFASGHFMERTVQVRRVISPEQVHARFGCEALLEIADVKTSGFDALAKAEGLDHAEQRGFIEELKPTIYLKIKSPGSKAGAE